MKGVSYSLFGVFLLSVSNSALAMEENEVECRPIPVAVSSRSVKEVTIDALREEITPDEFINFLKEESDKGNQEAKAQLFLLWAVPFGNFNWVDYKKAERHLLDGWREPWVDNTNVKKCLEKLYEDNKKWVIAFFGMLSKINLHAAAAIAEREEGDKKKALKLYEEAAALDHPDSMCHAGILRSAGFDDQPADMKRALEHFRTGAKLKHTVCMYNAGLMLLDGKGVPAQDKQGALQYFSQAADLGYALAGIHAGKLLFEGFKGQKPDMRRAFQYFEPEAKLGNKVAIHFIGAVFLRLGNYEAAYHHFQLAASLGDTPSMVQLFKFDLGLLGNVRADIPKALRVLEKAATSGDPDAKRILEDAEKQAEESKEKEEGQGDAKVDLHEKTEKTPDGPAIISHPGNTGKELLAGLHFVSPEGALPAETNFEIGEFPDIIETEAQPKPPKHNPKYERVRLVELGLLRKSQQNQVVPGPAEVPQLSKKVQVVANHILGTAKERAKIFLRDLSDLFKDPVFQGRVTLEETTQGYKVTIHPDGDTKPFVLTTHRKHDDSSQGDFDPAFISALRSILEMFDIKKL